MSLLGRRPRRTRSRVWCVTAPARAARATRSRSSQPASRSSGSRCSGSSSRGQCPCAHSPPLVVGVRARTPQRSPCRRARARERQARARRREERTPGLAAAARRAHRIRFLERRGGGAQRCRLAASRPFRFSIARSHLVASRRVASRRVSVHSASGGRYSPRGSI